MVRHTLSWVSDDELLWSFSRANPSTKMAALASDRLRYFQLLLCNYWTEFDETWPAVYIWSKNSMSNVLYQICVAVFYLWPIRLQRWPLWPMIRLNIFDFSSATNDEIRQEASTSDGSQWYHLETLYNNKLLMRSRAFFLFILWPKFCYIPNGKSYIFSPNFCPKIPNYIQRSENMLSSKGFYRD